MKGIYLGACRAYHPNYNLDYNDIVPGYHNNIICDMLDVDLSKYDYVIAIPPCNYYSICNYRRDVSDYALKTKHLLPGCIIKLSESGLPFLIENVRNYPLFVKCGIIDLIKKYGLFCYEYGRHFYITNCMLNFNNIPQRFDFKNGGFRINYHDEFSKYNQGGYNVHVIVEYFLEMIGAEKNENKN